MTRWMVDPSTGSTQVIRTGPCSPYQQDCLDYEDEACCIFLDGIIFNQSDLMLQQQSPSWADCLIGLYRRSGDAFCAALRGSFHGWLLDKQAEKLILFTDQIGDRIMFYSTEDCPVFLFGGDFWGILRRQKELARTGSESNPETIDQIGAETGQTSLSGKSAFKVEVDREACISLLTYAAMIDRMTFCRSIKRLLPGEYLVASPDGMEIKTYHAFDSSNPEERPFDTWIQDLDDLFLEVARKQFAKDQTYGKRTLIDLSGGLDSRMVAFTAKRLGVKDPILVSYSQLESYDHRVTEQVARQLNMEFYHKALDYPSFIFDLESSLDDNFGLTYYYLGTGTREMNRIMQAPHLGMEISGILGDMGKGTYSDTAVHEPPKQFTRFRAGLFMEEDPLVPYFDRFPNQEIMLFTVDGLRRMIGFHNLRRPLRETFSPLADVDFLDLTFCMPLDVRLTRGVFLQWMKRVHPEAAALLYDHSMAAADASEFRQKLTRRRYYYYPLALNKLWKKLGRDNRIEYKGSMNPFELWYATQADVREFIDRGIASRAALAEQFPEIARYHEAFVTADSTRDKLNYLQMLCMIERIQADVPAEPQAEADEQQISEVRR